MSLITPEKIEDVFIYLITEMRFMIFIYQRQMKTLTNFVYENIILTKIHQFSPVELAPTEFAEILIKSLLNRGE